MRLAKLTLAGFKSFADRTEFSFDEPIIGVVGPNGCGKSNVVDAIKWVLGERAKSLRGSAMQDVIFAGSVARKPLGLAEVTLTFENPQPGRTTRPLRADTDPADTPDGVRGELDRGPTGRRRPTRNWRRRPGTMSSSTAPAFGTVDFPWTPTRSP